MTAWNISSDKIVKCSFLMERNWVSENKRYHLCTHLGPINHDHEFVRESGRGGVQHLIHLNLHILTSVTAPVPENKTTHPSIYLPPHTLAFTLRLLTWQDLKPVSSKQYPPQLHITHLQAGSSCVLVDCCWLKYSCYYFFFFFLIFILRTYRSLPCCCMCFWVQSGHKRPH